MNNPFAESIILNDAFEERNLQKLVQYVTEHLSPNINALRFSPFYRTLLQECTIVCWYDAVKWLCNYPGIDVNVATKNSGWRAIHFAIRLEGDVGVHIVYKLLERGATLDIPQDIIKPRILDIQAWQQAQSDAIDRCKLACYAMLMIEARRKIPAMRDITKMIVRAILRTRLKRQWYKEVLW